VTRHLLRDDHLTPAEQGAVLELAELYAQKALLAWLPDQP
jgi:hypothetical protein